MFEGKNKGSEHNYSLDTSSTWSDWYDITRDEMGPELWEWDDVADMDCEIIADHGLLFTTSYCSKIELRVTYTINIAPSITNPVPVDASDGVNLTPTLKISVNDSEGNTMSIDWLTNFSGSWNSFGTNNSVTNGTYQQTYPNATENGQWFYWRVNVSDGTNYTVSDVFSFYTGYQSKIINTGNTSFKGFLLIQIQKYNSSTGNWSVVHDTVNESIMRTIGVGEQLGLDTIFNGCVNTNDLVSYGNGTYRMYAAFRDDYGQVLIITSGGPMQGKEEKLKATYDFTITIS